MQQGKVNIPGVLISLCLVAGVAYLRLQGSSGEAGNPPRNRDGAAPAVASAPAGAGVSAATAQYDYFLLSLSWSPSYCLVHDDDRAQCSKGYGFVLHGLWPQNAEGGYPENCARDATLSSAAQSRGAGLYPSPRLMQHEWQRHGTCSGLDALGYFDTADRALAAVKIPVAFEAPRNNQLMDARDIVAAFRAVNPGIPDNGIVVACNRTELSEVRVCLDKSLQPIECGRGVRNSCPYLPLRIPAAR